MGEMTMVERAAEAVLNARGAKRGVPPIRGLKPLIPRHTWEEATDIARAVIEAIREPTEAQIGAMMLHDWIGHPEAKPETIDRWRKSQRTGAIAQWQKGIDAALATPIAPATQEGEGGR